LIKINNYLEKLIVYKLNNMCGIFAYLGKNVSYDDIISEFFKIRHRGPDNSVLQQINPNLILGFHRLKMNDISNYGNQPLNHPDDNSIILICNGEIYNYKILKEKYSITTKSSSDCEIVLHLYKMFGFKKTVQLLDAEFSMVLYDATKNKLFASRCPFGVRGMFIGYKNEEVFISSEMKAISELCDKVIPFPPATIWSSDNIESFETYYEIPSIPVPVKEELVLKGIRDYFTKAVEKRIELTDRPIGCLLSGGLDSSLVTALVKKKIPNLKTFSIGIKGSIDLKYAKIVADYIKSDHYSIELSEEEFIGAIEEVIGLIESYDTTTVRASTGNYLVSKFITENSDCKVIFCGDGSDEQSGYRYLQNAPSIQDFQDECFKLLREIYQFDALRSDRTISIGKEARVPFLDKDFVGYYMSIDPKFKTYSEDKIEKYLLRKAFDEDDLLPKEVLWRSKCAFSDGVSSKKKSWHTIIQEHLESKISDIELENATTKYPFNTPKTKESLWYREIFERYYPNKANVIPHFWMPKWCGDIDDPSARELGINKEND
jgi:asparagine synthase (glutamine-hydrolysing)